MKIVSVVNYKGGVGKTTMSANIAAGLAGRGMKVLLIDLDPQASLTFSFFSPSYWRDRLADEHTIKQWYDSSGKARTAARLADLVVTPERVNQALAGVGHIDMIVSHQDLVAVDTLLADVLDSKSGQVPAARFVQVYRRLADGLADPRFGGYDYAIVDCPPNFAMMTKNAVVASEYLLIPTRPEYLSTNGINHLGQSVFGLVNEFNGHVQAARGRRQVQPIAAPVMRVAFTMVTFHGNAPMNSHAQGISRVRDLRAPTFSTLIRDRKAIYATAPEQGVPAVLWGNGHTEAGQEIKQLVDEFLHWTERGLQ